ncbi:MAG: hypothetical protein AAF490_07070 [Chloroflexota bacterium]
MQSTDIEMTQVEKRPLIKPLYVALGILGVLIISGLFIWLFIWLAQTGPGTIEAVRDLFIIFLALESCLFGIVLMILLVMVIRLVNVLEFEIKPILNKTNETVGTIRGTTLFVSDNVVKPVTRISSQAAGLSRALRVLFGNPRRNLEE